MMIQTVSQSRFWNDLWRLYAKAPSIAFCRVPELEFARRLDISQGKTLDHCCGDGKFSQMAWQGASFSVGCDFDAIAIANAKKRNLYGRLDVCDVSERLPYADGEFDTIFNNSAIEHVLKVDNALSEVARVLKVGGTFAFNVLNHRYFEWWQLGDEVKTAYQAWQPFYHAWNSEQWRTHLANVGLRVVSVEGYFDQHASQELALLDSEFSGQALANRPSKLVSDYHRWGRLSRLYWKYRLSNIAWQTEPEGGAGYFIKAVKDV
jgi:SAM-dependent methyltransferase